MSIVVMVISAAAIIALVKFGLVKGLDHISLALSWSAKARGQAMGYATSAPEFVTLGAAGLAGVWDAGLWNIASSNIINWGLMLAAVMFYRQGRSLLNRQFVDEMGFALLAVAVPLLLMQFELDTHWMVIPILLALFVFYLFADKRLNTKPATPAETEDSTGNLPLGIIMCVTALVLVAVAGVFLGDATKSVVEQMGIRPAIAGWILGLVTSLPEAVTFFSVFAVEKKKGTLGEINDTQEALDNLAASNMSNTGLIYPIGLAVYLLVGVV